MPVTTDGFDRVDDKLARFFDNMAPDLKLVGETGAEAIVRTTLAGIGEDDEAFAPYSRVYQEIIEAVGGKPQQTVNLRGLFYHEGQQRKRYRSDASRQREGEGRQAYIGVRFDARTLDSQAAGGRAQIDFTARTGVTRPQLGLTDPRSEMSLDLIRVESTDDSLSIIYSPREKPYMVSHQTGSGNAPARPWFSVRKRAVWEAMHATMATIIKSRGQWFNDHSQGGNPPRVVMVSSE